MNYLIDRMADRIRDCIERRKLLTILSFSLIALSFVTQLLRMRSDSRRICDARMYIECQRKSHRKAAQILVSFAGKETPGADSIRLFLYEVLAHVDPQHAQDLMKAKYFDPQLVPIVEAALLRRDGELREVLSALDYVPSTFTERVHLAEFRRSVFLEERMHEEFAVDGISRLSHDLGKPLFAFAASVAAAADSAGRDDILRLAIQRILSDQDAILKDPRLLSKFAQQSAEASLWLFDLTGATRVIDGCRKHRMERVAKRLERRLNMEELKSMSAMMDRAYHDVLARVGLRNRDLQKHDAIIVVPSAAFRSNKIDYPGFRANIRLVLTTIAESLEAMNIRYGIKAQIKLHGHEDLPLPFFSYHTVSNHRNGLHFKETDRPSHFSFDTGGYSGWSEFSQKSSTYVPLNEIDAARAEIYFRRDQEQTISNNLSKYMQKPLRDVDVLPDRFVFVALQMTGDSVQELAYSSPIEMMDEVVSGCEKIGYTVVVKRHPLCGSTIIGKYLFEKERAGRIIVATGSIHNIIAKSAAVCVVNSGVGAEALLHEKPVFLFGRSDYMGACFVCREPGDFEKQFVPGRSALSSSDLRRFWYLLRTHYAVDLRDVEQAKAAIRSRVEKHIAGFELPDLPRMTSSKID